MLAELKWFTHLKITSYSHLGIPDLSISRVNHHSRIPSRQVRSWSNYIEVIRILTTCYNHWWQYMMTIVSQWFSPLHHAVRYLSWYVSQQLSLYLTIVIQQYPYIQCYIFSISFSYPNSWGRSVDRDNFQAPVERGHGLVGRARLHLPEIGPAVATLRTWNEPCPSRLANPRVLEVFLTGNGCSIATFDESGRAWRKPKRDMFFTQKPKCKHD